MVEFGDQVTASAAVVFLLQAAKNKGLLPYDSPGITRGLAALAAALATAGITYSYDATLDRLVIDNLLGAGLHFFWETCKAFSFQEVIFRAAVKGK